MKGGLIRKVRVNNFKSLAACAVRLNQFTVFVGSNGAGKSNFVDSLKFVSECLRGSVAQALRSRGGIGEVRRHSRGHPTNFGFRIVIEFSGTGYADYSFEIKAEMENRFTVKKERCVISRFMEPVQEYLVERGAFTHEVPGIRSRIEPDSLALPILSALPEYRGVHDFLSNMTFYSLSPDKIRELQEADSGTLLRQDGSNAAAVLREIMRRNQPDYERLCRLLTKVVPGTSSAVTFSVGPKETIRFKQDVGDAAPWNFNAMNMSDGTLRVLGILLAMYQIGAPSVVAIEEPEATIHPAAIDVIVDILKEGAKRTQVIVTTHSPEILDNKGISDEDIRFVRSSKGVTTIAPLDEVTRNAIKDRLYSAGELLAVDELRGDDAGAEQLASQLALFGEPVSS